MTEVKEKKQIYRKLDEIEHVLQRPGMYIGSTQLRTEDVWVFDKVFVKESIKYNPGFIKLFDEIILNSVDEHRRNPKLNCIKVEVNQQTGLISVWDNGGIPVEVFKDEDGKTFQKQLGKTKWEEYIPEMIFSSLRAGSNFNDDEERIGAGTNGVGASLTNIFSKTFTVETADGKHYFHQEFSDNLAKFTVPEVKKLKQNYTKISYITDFSRFKMSDIDDDTMKMLKKRCVDIAGCNCNLKVYFNGEMFSFKSFKDYASLYCDLISYDANNKWEIAIGVSENGYQHVSFVNSVDTYQGGTHVGMLQGDIINGVRPFVAKKHKIDLKPNDIRNHLFLFINATVVNPAFSSQTKENFITEITDFVYKYTISNKVIADVFKSDIIQNALDWYEQKKQAEERAELRKLNKGLNNKKILKLIDAKANNNRHRCILGIFEGESALSPVRQFRDAQTFGAYPLRGKFTNVSEMKAVDVIKNQEVQDLVAAIGLKLGEAPDFKNLRYGKIYIYTDADQDGNNIAGLMINFFGKYWPELFEHNMIFKVLTPLMIAKKGSTVKIFYDQYELDEWLKTANPKQWVMEYKKGLAALEDDDYNNIINNPKVLQMKKDKSFNNTLKLWFSGDSQPRKEKILGTYGDIAEDEVKGLF